MIMSVIGIIGSIWTAISFLVKFLKGFLLKYATHAVILGIQFTITSATILFVLAFYAFTITAYVALYNKALEIVNSLLTYHDGTLASLYGLLNCMGVLPAISYGISIFFVALGSIMTFHLFKFTYGAMGAIKDEIFKLGVLLGQAVD